MKRLKLRGWVKVVIILLIMIFTYNLIIEVNSKLNNKYKIENDQIKELINIGGK